MTWLGLRCHNKLDILIYTSVSATVEPEKVLEYVILFSLDLHNLRSLILSKHPLYLAVKHGPMRLCTGDEDNLDDASVEETYFVYTFFAPL